ncbi:hypothetical protein VCHA38O209_50267 [Vibrio chagasii]|nr:hypothetical protein VCHA38O209_50267 [Vibrio chagasii]
MSTILEISKNSLREAVAARKAHEATMAAEQAAFDEKLVENKLVLEQLTAAADQARIEFLDLQDKEDEDLGLDVAPRAAGARVQQSQMFNGFSPEHMSSLKKVSGQQFVTNSVEEFMALLHYRWGLVENTLNPQWKSQIERSFNKCSFGYKDDFALTGSRAGRLDVYIWYNGKDGKPEITLSETYANMNNLVNRN